jgi:hypothetical protein
LVTYNPTKKLSLDMSALNLFKVTPKFSTCTMFVMFTFEIIYSTLTGLWYGQEKFGYPAPLILLECCTINICAADVSRKMSSLQLKGYTSTEWQLPVAQILFHSHSHNLLSLHYIPFLGSLALSYNSQR